jgi:hypothetical protein
MQVDQAALLELQASFLENLIDDPQSLSSSCN